MAKEIGMKWHKFKEEVAKYPWLVDVIDPLGNLRHDPKTYSVSERLTLLRPFVRNQLDDVAFRPWRTFDPHAAQGDHETSMTLEHAVRCDPYYGGSRDASYRTEWEIVWHVGDRPSTPTPHREGYTISESMTEIIMEHKDGRFGAGDLVFDYVVKRITESASKQGRVTMAIEVFTVPFFLIEKLQPAPGARSPMKMTESELDVYRAYVRGQPMSALVPSR